jgi:hypothetical protein
LWKYRSKFILELRGLLLESISSDLLDCIAGIYSKLILNKSFDIFLYSLFDSDSHKTCLKRLDIADDASRQRVFKKLPLGDQQSENESNPCWG